jgi:Flp pilus assembly protein TadD
MHHMGTNDTPPSQSTEAVDALIEQGLAASRADRTDEALALFAEAARLAPPSGIPHFLIGAELAQLGRMDEAEAAYANAVLLAPELDMARYQLGLIQFTSGRMALALVTWTPFLQRPDDDPLQRIVHGFAALAQDDAARALACFREGIALNAHNAPLNADLQRMIDRIEQQPGIAPATADPAPQPPDAPDSEEQQHVLLSNYGRHGLLH